MTEYEVRGREPHVTVTFGWDAKASSYFAQVYDERADWWEDGELLLVGTTPGEVRTVRRLAAVLAPFVTLSRRERAELVRDRVRQSGRLELTRK